VRKGYQFALYSAGPSLELHLPPGVKLLAQDTARGCHDDSKSSYTCTCWNRGIY
jgi:hypothetical protein